MSKKHAALLFPFLVLVVYAPSVAAWATGEPTLLILYMLSLLCVLFVVGMGHDVGFHTIPVTRWMRLSNHRYTALKKAREESRAAYDCEQLAGEYRERGEDVQADILEAESAYRRRLSEMHDEDSRRYGRAIQDEEMRRLTG